MQEIEPKNSVWADFIRGIEWGSMAERSQRSETWASRIICVPTYTTRKLTKESAEESDASNAFRGVLHRVQEPLPSTGLRPVPCLLGLPPIGAYVSEISEHAKNSIEYGKLYFADSFAWHDTQAEQGC